MYDQLHSQCRFYILIPSQRLGGRLGKVMHLIRLSVPSDAPLTLKKRCLMSCWPVQNTTNTNPYGIGYPPVWHRQFFALGQLRGNIPPYLFCQYYYTHHSGTYPQRPPSSLAFFLFQPSGGLLNEKRNLTTLSIFSHTKYDSCINLTR